MTDFLSEFLFGKEGSIGLLFPDSFVPAAPDEAIALGYAVVRGLLSMFGILLNSFQALNCLDEWKTGTCLMVPFLEKVYGAVYRDMLQKMRELRSQPDLGHIQRFDATRQRIASHGMRYGLSITGSTFCSCFAYTCLSDLRRPMVLPVVAGSRSTSPSFRMPRSSSIVPSFLAVFCLLSVHLRIRSV